MKTIWQILNAPLVVVLIALIGWPIFLAMSSAYALKIGIKDVISTVNSEIVNPFQAISSKQKDQNKVVTEVLKKVEVTNTKVLPSSWPGKEKVIGSITNRADKTISSIKLTASYYDGENVLVDVGHEWLSNISSIESGQSREFTFDRSLGSQGGGDTSSGAMKAASVKILVTSVSLSE